MTLLVSKQVISSIIKYGINHIDTETNIPNEDEYKYLLIDQKLVHKEMSYTDNLLSIL